MSDRETVKIPVAVLKVGETRQIRVDLEFPDPPIVFKLIEGAGPVYIHGQHLSGIIDEEIEDIDEVEDEMDREDGEEEEEEDEEEEGNPKKKLKLSNNAKGGVNKAVPAAIVKNNKKK